MKLARKLSVFLIAGAFGASILSGIEYGIRDAAERDAYFQEQARARREGQITFSGPYCYPDKQPRFLLTITVVTGLAFALVLFQRFEFLGLSFCFGALGLYWYWYSSTQYANSLAEIPYISGLNAYLYRAGPFDVIAASSLVIGTALLSTVLAQSVVAWRSSCKLP